MRKHLHKLFAISMAMALGLMAQAQTQFQAVVPSGQTLNFKTMGATTCRVWYNDSGVVGDLVIPETVEHEGTTYRVTSMVEHAFEPNSNYNALTSVVIPSSITYLPKGAFWRCDGLKSVWLPPTLTSIGESAFRGCKSLTKVIIPASVNSIGSLAFASQVFPGEMVLDTVIFLREDPPTFGQNVFHTGVSRTVKIWSPLHRFRADNPYIVALGGQTSVSFTYTVYDYHSTPAHVNHIYDTIHPGESRTFAGRILTAGGDYTDSTWYYTHDSLITLHLTAVPWHFYATVPSGQSLNFEITSPTTCQLAGNTSIGGSATDSLIIPYTVSDGTNTYQVTAIGGKGINGFLGRGTLMLPNSITRIEWNGLNNNDFDTIIFPAGLNFMDNGAVRRSTRVGSPSVLVFRSATPPAVKSSYLNAFSNGYTADEVRHIYVPAGQTAAYQSAFGTAFPNATLHEWGTSTPTEVNRYDTIHPGEVRWINNRPYDGTWSVRDSSLYYTHNIITRVHLQAVQWHFYANAPTGQRLYYHITGTDSVEVVAPNGNGWAYYTPPTDSLAIPATVTHDGHTYSVFRIANRAFYRCDAISALTLPEGIAEVGTEAIFIMTSRELRVSLPRSLRIIGDAAFNTNAFNSRLKLASDTIWAEVIGREAFFPKVISQPIVLPNVRTIGDKGFYRIGSCPYLWVGDSCTSIGEQAFAEYTTAPNVPIPGRISLGTSLQTVGASAFSRPNGRPIHSVEFRGTTVPSFGAGVFKNTQIDSIITPCGTSAAYRAALDAAPVNEDWDPSATLFAERGCTVVVHIYDTMCVGATYHWANKAIISGGTFYDTVHRPLYDSVTILHLVSEGNWNIGGGSFPEMYCETSLPFTWHEQYIDAPGDYTHDERVLTTRGCWLKGTKYEMTVFQRPHTYIYDTVRSTAKGYDYSDTTETTVPVNSYPCRDSLVTTITWHDFDETTDTVRTILYDTICAGTIYHFGGRYLLRSDTYYDTVRMPFRDSITVLHLEVEGTMANSLHTEVICETSLPYIWDGDTITTPGTHHLDHSVFNPRGCLMSGSQLQLTVVPRAKTYIYDTVVSTSKGYDYDDTTKVSMLRQGSHNSPCPDSLVTTYTHYDLDESVDTLRVYGTHQQCDGTYLFGGIERTATGTYTDTVVVDPFHVTITTLDLTVNYSSTGDTAAVACDAFTWHGTTYTASAAPQHVYTNAAGCDSTVTLALTVNYSNTGDTAAVACDAFTWHGTTYTASAAPQHVYTSAAGCDSTVTLALTVNYSNTGDTAAVACDAFTWHGTTYTASAAPQYVYTNAAGCDSTVTLALTVNYSNTGDTAAVACDAFTWHGVDYTAAAAPQHVYTNAAGCDSTVTLALTVNYSNTGDTAAVACDAFTWHGTTYTAAAAPQYVYTNAAGCDSTVTLALTINYSNTGDTAAVACDAFTWHGTTYTASAAPQHVYTNAAGCDSTVTLTLTVNYSNTGDTAAVACDAFTWHGTTYTASAAPQHVYTNAAGCDSTVTLALTVNYSNTGDTAAVACDAFTWHGVDYTASAAPQHVYTNVAGCDSTVTLALTVNYSNTGDTAAVACDAFTWHGTTYTASAAPQHVYTNAAGCDSTVTLALTVNYSNTGDTAAVACDAFTWHGTTYTASAAPQHVYTNAAGCDSTVTLALTVNYSNTGDTAAVACDAFTWHGTTYTASAAPQHVYINAAGCDSTVTLALTVNYSNTGDTAAVACDAFTWHGVDYTASAAPQHVYTNAAGCDSTVTLALTINYSNTGDTAAVACDAFTWHGTTYTASAAPQHVYTNAAGCDSTVTLALIVNYSNTGDTAAVACDAFTWHGTTYTAAAAPQHVYTNAAGCDSTVTLALTVNYSNTGDTAAVACDAFTWHGTTYTASAAPQHVYTNAAGCDSTVTLALTVNYSNTGDTAAVACDAFTWHGTTYTASAAPQHVYTNAAGCDSTVTLTLTINYSNTGDTAAVACDAFTWHGVDYTAAAAPQHVYTNAAGCDSTVTLALTINYSNTGDTAAVACDAFTWHGVDYTASAAPQHVYTNAAGCDSTVTLALTINYGNTGTETADVCDEYTWQGITYTVSNTTDQVVLTNVAGCDSTVTLNLTVRHSNTGDTVAVTFDAFTWYGHTYRATTTATHTLTNVEGCDSTVTLALTILESYSTDAAFGENGIEVEAYGYCAGPGAVRYRLSSGQPNEYRLAFAHAAFPAADWTPITTPGSIDIEVPAGLVTGDYSAVLQFRHSSWPELTSAAIPVVIHVNLPETYVQPLFNDVIALVDTCQCLTDVQWYHREAGETEWTLIPGANDYYYHQEGGLTGEYFVSAKMNGVETYTCPQSDMGTLITDGNITLTAYPNPTASVVTLTLDGSRRASHEVRVLTTTGIELERRSFEGDSLRMDLSAYPRGSYIVSVDGMAVRVIRN